MSLGSVCTVLEQGLDDHGSWYCMYGTEAPARLPRLLVVYERYWNTD